MPTRRIHRFSRSAAGVLAVAALAAPAANARPILEPSGDPGSESAAAIEYEADTSAPAVARTADDGFEWGSAAVGAGGAAAFLLLAGAGATTLSRRHHQVGVSR